MVSLKRVVALGLVAIVSVVSVSDTPQIRSTRAVRKTELPTMLEVEGKCHPLFGMIEFKNSVPLAYSAKLRDPKLSELRQSLIPYIERGELRTPEEVMDFSLRFVSDNLDFRWNYFWGARGGGYRQFPSGMKSTDCVDYAFLFAETVRETSAAVGLTGLEPTVMRSGGYLAGEFFDHHDWVAVTDKNTKRTYKIDPTFYDYKMNPDIGDLVSN